MSSIKVLGMNEEIERKLATSSQFLADRGSVGFLWADTRLMVTATYGKLVEDYPTGEPLSQAIPLFAGLDEDFDALRAGRMPYLSFAQIGLKYLKDDQKVSVRVYWQPGRNRGDFLIMLSAHDRQSELEYELLREKKARRLAEEQLQMVREEAVEKQSVLDLVAAHAPAGIAMTDRKGTYIFATQRWLEDCRKEAEDLLGHPHAGVFPFTEIAHVSLPENLSKLDDWRGVLPVERPNGEREWIRLERRPWLRANGTEGGDIMFNEIVSERVRSRVLLERANRDLRQANEDLEEFAFIISHDFKAPLRAITFVLSLLEEELETPLSPDVADYLAKLKKQSTRMDRMITGLLQYARIGMSEETMGRVDLAALLREIVGSIAPDGHMKLTLAGQDWPILETASAPLDLVLRNLLDNAVKFHDREEGNLHVAIREETDHFELVVTDDGPGIPEEYHRVIFEPFQKLESYDSVPGSGMGLAYVNKVLERLGGKICLIEPRIYETGASFKVIWPKEIRRNT